MRGNCQFQAFEALFSSRHSPVSVIVWYNLQMAAKRPAKPKLTDAERHKRFVAMAREVEADEKPEAFDRAFKQVTKRKGSTPSNE